MCTAYCLLFARSGRRGGTIISSVGVSAKEIAFIRVVHYADHVIIIMPIAKSGYVGQ